MPPIIGLEEQRKEQRQEQRQKKEQTQEQRREHSEERMMRRAVERDQHRAKRMDGTIGELANGPDYAPYVGNDWDGLGRGGKPKPGTVATTVVKPGTIPSSTTWQRQLDGFVAQFKRMLGLK